MLEPINVTYEEFEVFWCYAKIVFTWGESNGYWSENLNNSWNFSPSYNVPDAPSMSIRILKDEYRKEIDHCG